MRNSRHLTKAATLVADAQGAPDHQTRVALIARAQDVLELALRQALNEANDSGITWRELAEITGTPFQTLYRRYRPVSL